MCNLLRRKKFYQLSEVGICPNCFKIKRGLKPFDKNNLDEFYKNTCNDCGSEAIDIAYESMYDFFLENSVEELDNLDVRWEDIKDKFGKDYWLTVKRRLTKLRALRVSLGAEIKPEQTFIV